jgi:hypothetical protein
MFAFHAMSKFPGRAIGIILLGSLPWFAAGCGGRQSLEGKVLLDDRPLELGYINFRPLSDAQGPPIGGPIENGWYSIRPASVLKGPFRVEITALGKTGKKGLSETGVLMDLEGQVLPDRYNAKSTLRVDIEPYKRNKFPFSLKSK